MDTLIDISRKCDGTCKCYVNQDPGISATRNDNISNIDNYGHCIHIAGSKKLVLYWKSINLETTSGIPFTKLQSVTTYYHKHYDLSTINRPLIIKVETNAGNILWYENAGHYINKKWRKIGNAGDYTLNFKLKSKLTEVACRLYGYHQIDIQYTGRYSYICPICNLAVSGNVDENRAPKGISGYTKYTHRNITDKSILTHNGKRITYKRKDNGEAYYIPIPINDSNISSISAYYWDRDAQRDNPLLIEILGSGVSFLFENIGELSRKNEKWRPLSRQESDGLSGHGEKFKEKLDFLNCYINKVVEIRFGVTKCHSSKYGTQHKNRINSLFTRTLETSLISSYEYTPSSDYKNEPFVVSKFFSGSLEQSFPVGSLPLKRVEKLIYYMSPCDISSPFLVYAKSNGNNRWFKRTNGATWQENGVEFSNNTPEKTSNEIITLFNQLKTSLRISECLSFVHSSSSAVKLDIKESTDQGKRNKVYNDGNISIIVTKTERDPRYRFFKNTHTATKIPFDVKKDLQGSGQIGTVIHRNVTDFSVYFWEGEPNVPILIGITTKGSNKPTFYGKRITNSPYWMFTSVSGMTEQEALDHQNCKLNDAIPFDIKNPLLFSASNSECLNSRTQVISSNGSRQIGKDDRYLIEYYKINNVNVKISRATYNNEDTTVTPPNIPISQIRVYYWSKRPSEPLMVEFKPRGRWESVWFERLTYAGTVWESICKIDSEAFYSEPKNSDPTPQFIKRLDKVSCTINHAVKIDISKKDVRYCHEKCSNKRIYSKRVSSEIPNYIIYEHISAIDNEKTFTISSIYNDIIKQDIGDLVLNLYNIEKLIVFFPTCNERVPVAIHIEHMVGPIKEDKWLERTSDDNWRDVTIDFQGKTGDVVALKGLMDKIREDTEACNQYHLPNTQHTSALAGKVPTLDDETVDVSLKNDLGGDDLGYGDEEYYEVKEEDKLEIPTLSALQSSPQGITIDIRRKLSEDGGTYIPPNGQIVQLSREEYPLGSGFYKFTHKSPSGGSFKVKEVKYDGKTINHSRLQFDNASDIEHLAVWYWSGDTSMNSPLLTEVKVRAGEYKYSKNEGGNNWVQHARDSSEEKRPFQGESLEHTLDGLNCQHNNAVTMDLSFQNSEERSKKHTSSGNGNRYCCIYHKETSAKRITVTPHEVSCTEHSNNSTHIPYFKHDVTCAGKVKLAKIKYYPNGSNNSIRKRIKLEDNDFPIEGSLTVSAFYCTGEAPVLIYLEYNGKKDHLKGWYKKGTQDTDPWGRVAGNISTKTPYGIKSCSDERFKALVKELSSFGCKYGQCPEYTKLSFPQDFGRSSATGREPPVVNDGKTGGDIGEDCLKTLVNLGITGSVVASAVGIETLRTTLELARKAIDALPTENHTTKGYFAPVMGSQGSGAAGSSGPKIPEGQNFVQNAQDSSSENLKSEPALKAVNGSSVAPTQQPSAYGDSNSGKNAKAEGLPKIDELPQAEEAVSRYSESSEKEQNVVKSEISQLTKTSLQATETQGEGIRPGPAPAGGGGGETSKADPPAEGQPKVAGSTSSASQPPGEPKSPQAIVAETAATATGLGVIFGSSSGTLAGSAATFFAGWKLYNRYKGDPWVRQI